MPFNEFLFLNYLHILSAAVLIGVLAGFPLLDAETRRAREASVARHNMRLLNRLGSYLLVPSIVLLFLTGLLMAAGPWARWNMFSRAGRWILTGLILWLLLASAVGFLVGTIKRALPLVEEAEGTDGPELGGLWRQISLGIFASLLLALIIEAVMVFRPA